MKIVYIIFLTLMCFSSYSQSNLELDESIDSLKNLRSHDLTDSEKLELMAQIRQLIKLKHSNKTHHIFPNLDSINQENDKTVEKLWSISKLKTTTPSQRENLYSTITSYQKGLDLLIENIDYYKYDYDEMSIDGLNHYPVILFLNQTNSAILYDYIKVKVCDNSYVDKLQYLLNATINDSIDKDISIMILKSYLDKECVGIQQKTIIRSHLNLIK